MSSGKVIFTQTNNVASMKICSNSGKSLTRAAIISDYRSLAGF
jgi:hypothetical protein